MALSSYYGDTYDGQRHYAEQERRYREEMERERNRMYNSMQNTAVYNPYTQQSQQGMTDLAREQDPKPKKAAQPEYLNNKLLLLEN